MLSQNLRRRRHKL